MAIENSVSNDFLMLIEPSQRDCSFEDSKHMFKQKVKKIKIYTHQKVFFYSCSSHFNGQRCEYYKCTGYCLNAGVCTVINGVAVCQ